MNSTAPSSNLEIQAFNYYVAALQSREVQIVIPNLSPSTLYNVYCLSMDFNGNSIGLETVLANSLQVSTSCCGSLSISVDSPGDSSYPVLHLRLSSSPSQTSTVFLAVSSQSCEGNSSIIDGVSAAKSMPSSLTFTENSLFLTQAFAVIGPPGCYSIKANSSFGYDSITTSLRIANTSDPPSLSKAQFSEDGRYVTAVFSSCTDFGVTRGVSIKPGFSCSEVLILPNTDNTSIVCLWLSCSVIQIDQRQDGTLLAGDLIGLQNEVIRSSTSDDGIYSTVNYVPIEPSPTLTCPSVILFGPAIVTACQDIVLDSTRSTASGGRAWQKVRWTVLMGISRLNLSDYLNSNYRDTDHFVIIPSGFLETDMYQVELTLTNFMGCSSTSKHSFTIIMGDIVLEANILQPVSTSMFRNESLRLTAFASVATCNAASALTNTALDYSWSVYEGTLLRPEIFSLSLDGSQFWLPADVLNASSLYLLSVSVSTIINGTNYEVSDIIELNIKSGGIVAAIDGGSPRSVSFNSTLSLNASSSFLVDDPSCLACLGYSWSCFDTLFSTDPNCGLNLTGPGGDLALPPNTIPENNTLVFTVAVSDLSGQATFASTELRTQPYPSPSVSVRNLGNGKINPGDMISLSGSLVTYSSSIATWTSDDMNIPGLSQTFNLPGGFPYTIDSNLLFPGQSYTFTLQAAFVSSAEEAAFASILITMNSPPSGITHSSPLKYHE